MNHYENNHNENSHNNKVETTPIVSYAEAAVTNHTVTFNLNGGSRTGGGQLSQQVAPNGATTAPTVTRANHNFTGWTPNVAGMAKFITQISTPL